jgi:hypothetical protein
MSGLIEAFRKVRTAVAAIRSRKTMPPAKKFAAAVFALLTAATPW